MKKNIHSLLPFFVLFSLLFLNAYPGNLASDEEISVKDISPFTYCSLSHKGPYSDIEKVIGMLIQTMQSQNISPMGPMMGIFYSDPETTKPEDLEWEVGFPITPQALPQSPLQKKQWDFPLVAVALHRGPYEKTPETIAKILEWVHTNGYAAAGPVMERYLDSNPSQVSPEDLRTEIWVPCQKVKKYPIKPDFSPDTP